MKQNSPEPTVPFSQDNSKRVSGTRDAIIADIRRLVEAEPDRFITRNHYRVHGAFAESAWSEHFGTWGEAKRAANITPSRHVQNHEKHIAKHASTERYRAMTEAKRGWEDAYLRPCVRRFATDIVITDVHDTECDPFVRRIFMDTVARVQPRRVVLGGDTFDLAEFGKYAVDPRTWDVVGRITYVHGFLDELRNVAPDAELVMLEGNHEARLLRHLAEASPAMRAVLADLHGFTVPKLLGLDKYEVNYIARADLATFTQSDLKAEVSRNYYVAPGGQYLIHHFPQGEAMKLPGAHGHHHRHQVSQHFSPMHGEYEWHQLGAAHRRHASYTAGEQWGNGFLLLHIDNETNRVVHDYIAIRDHAVVGGRWYQRQADEV